MQAIEHDIVIVGGGVIGSVFALLASQLGLNIGLIEVGNNLKDNFSEKQLLRTVALSPFSIQILEYTAIWNQIKAYATPYQAMQVWDDQQSATIYFNANDYALNELGYIVEQQRLSQILLKNLESNNAVTTYFNTNITDLSLGRNTIVLSANKRQLTAKLIVGADGARSAVRDLANISIKRKDYQQTALVTKIVAEKHHDFVARQRFLPTGPLAFLPLAGKQNSVIWSLDKSHVDHYLAMDEQQLRQSITEASQCVLGEVIQMSERSSFPLSMQLADRYMSERIALIGDAAHVVHPMAGQGVNLGIQDVVTLINVIALALKKNSDIGSLPILRHYERSRKSDAWLMATGLNELHRLFSSRYQTLKLMRRFGLNLVNRCGLFKRCFVDFASGLNTEQVDALTILKSYVR